MDGPARSSRRDRREGREREKGDPSGVTGNSRAIFVIKSPPDGFERLVTGTFQSTCVAPLANHIAGSVHVQPKTRDRLASSVLRKHLTLVYCLFAAKIVLILLVTRTKS